MHSKTPEGLKTDFPSGMGKVAPRSLAIAGYTRLRQLTKVTEAELLKIHGVGPKAMRILREALREKGMSFAPSAKPTTSKVKSKLA
jgi:predicted flap endonuclease-1-like 5' DNA nuclease